MWKLMVALLIIAFTTSIILERLLRKKKLKKDALYWIINIVGVYIPIIFIFIYYSYISTDTLKDNIAVASLVAFICIIYFLENKFLKICRYNWAIIPIVTILVFLIYLKLISYIVSIHSITNIVFALFIFPIMINLNDKLNRKKLMVSGIITIALVLVASFKYNEEIKWRFKPVRYAIEYVQDKGYQVNDSYQINAYNSYLKPKEINILIIIRNKDESKKEYLTMKYRDEHIENFEIVEINEGN